MTKIEKRKYTRVNSLNLSYVCIDENGEILNEGMGRTLNVSEGGILLETGFCILPKQNLMLTIAVEDHLLDIKGKVVRCGEDKANKFHTGVEFLDIDEAASTILKKFIQLFNSEQLEVNSEQ
jgi:c-di-GMP-binding flagellar brake protein YcgR